MQACLPYFTLNRPLVITRMKSDSRLDLPQTRANLFWCCRVPDVGLCTNVTFLMLRFDWRASNQSNYTFTSCSWANGVRQNARDWLVEMMQRTANENVACLRRICKRSELLQILRGQAAFSFAVLCIISTVQYFWGRRSFQIRYAAHF